MRPATPRRPPLTTGLYYTQPGFGTTTASPTLNRLRVFPFDNHRPRAFDRMATEVTVAAGSATLRWVVYADNGSSYPGALILDTGAVGDASGTGVKEATVALALAARRYWLGCILQGADATLRLHATTSAAGLGIPSANLSGGLGLGYFASGYTGAAPSTFPTVAAGAASTSQAPAVWLRAA